MAEESARCVDGVADDLRFLCVAASHRLETAVSFDPIEHLFHDIEGKSRRRIEHRTVLVESFVIEHRRSCMRLAFIEKGAIDDDDAATGDAEIFLSRSEDEPVRGNVDRSTEDVAAHIGDERKRAARGAFKFRAQKTVIGAIIDVVGIVAVDDFVVIGDVLKAVL